MIIYQKSFVSIFSYYLVESESESELEGHKARAGIEVKMWSLGAERKKSGWTRELKPGASHSSHTRQKKDKR